MSEPFRLRFAPGVTPDKWLRTWAARMPGAPIDAALLDAEDDDPTAALRRGECSMAFVRLPVDRSGLHVIPLYEEVPVVIASREHPVAAFDEVDVTDLADENLLQDPGAVPEWSAAATDRPRPALEPMTVAQAVAVAASGAGVLIVPLSVARLHHRKDVVHRPVTGVATSQVGLAWRTDDDDPRIETFIGIVRGRTERSSRGGTAADGAGPKDGAATGATTGKVGATGSRGGSGRSGGGQQRRTSGRGSGGPGRGGRPRGRR
ncbi:LysR substrate binding domain-containing protein [Georgenia soli]|uniref:LysR substrate binding domain-containing protein n=1 Tax=Georgenia soli TaxID=638953 RepID=A0A2A9EHT5_9MICO|nr:LysR substrate-binding domain-containing protein [Georgenia soli]PFG38448.1 LysR substrate binding domain-containing protein [Georgenia soli]